MPIYPALPDPELRAPRPRPAIRCRSSLEVRAVVGAAFLVAAGLGAWAYGSAVLEHARIAEHGIDTPATVEGVFPRGARTTVVFVFTVGPEGMTSVWAECEIDAAAAVARTPAGAAAGSAAGSALKPGDKLAVRYLPEDPHRVEVAGQAPTAGDGSGSDLCCPISFLVLAVVGGWWVVRPVQRSRLQRGLCRGGTAFPGRVIAANIEGGSFRPVYSVRFAFQDGHGRNREGRVEVEAAEFFELTTRPEVSVLLDPVRPERFALYRAMPFRACSEPDWRFATPVAAAAGNLPPNGDIPDPELAAPTPRSACLAHTRGKGRLVAGSLALLVAATATHELAERVAEHARLAIGGDEIYGVVTARECMRAGREPGSGYSLRVRFEFEPPGGGPRIEGTREVGYSEYCRLRHGALLPIRCARSAPWAWEALRGPGDPWTCDPIAGIVGWALFAAAMGGWGFKAAVGSFRRWARDRDLVRHGRAVRGVIRAIYGVHLSLPDAEMRYLTVEIPDARMRRRFLTCMVTEEEERGLWTGEPISVLVDPDEPDRLAAYRLTAYRAAAAPAASGLARHGEATCAASP